MNIKELQEIVEKDMSLDKTELAEESVRTPQLHNKYLIFFMDEKLKLRKLISESKILRRNKWLYYTGKMSEEELKTLQWEPFEISLLKTDVDRFIESDSDIIQLEDKISFLEEKVSYLENILKTIMNRQWAIRSAIDWIKFTNGS